MKNKNLSIVAIIVSGVCILIGVAFANQYVGASNKLILGIEVSKKSYQLGEIIPITARITNNTNEPIYLAENLIEPPGIKIAFGGSKDYKLYARQGRYFTLDGVYPDITINPGETFTKQDTILWNYKPETTGLSDHVVSQMTDGRILSDYAFTKAGIYFVKFYLTIPKDGKPINFESEPLKITITEPNGENLDVWNKIKDNGDIGYFLQEGDLIRGRYYTAEERAKFQQEVQQIISEHPNSFYAQSLRQSLDKFRASEAERQEYMKKLYKQKPQ